MAGDYLGISSVAFTMILVFTEVLIRLSALLTLHHCSFCIKKYLGMCTNRFQYFELAGNFLFLFFEFSKRLAEIIIALEGRFINLLPGAFACLD